MKTLTNILKANYGDFMDGNQLQTFTEGTIIVAIMNNGRAVPCTPQTYHDITCPMCGSSEGYKVFDNGAYWWACRHRKCIAKNAGQPIVYEKAKVDIEDVLERVGVTMRLRSASFDDWKHSESLKGELLKYAKNPKEPYTFIGRNGVGKSYSSVAILREYYRIHKDFPIFYNVSMLYQDWLSNAKSPVALMYKLTSTPLLVLDDLGTRTPTEAFGDFIYLIINSRYADMKGTIITTNLTTDELAEKFGNAIVSRLFSGDMVDLEGEDLRRDKK